MFLSLNHVSILVSNTQKSVDFYQQLLGLTCLPRPDLGFNGAWLDLGLGQSLHLLELPQSIAQRNIQSHPQHPGRDAHFALNVDDLTPYLLKIEQQGLRFTPSKSGRPAIFLRDPDGNGFELLQADRKS